MPLLSERPDRNSASISNTSRPIHLPAPYCLLETPGEHSQMLLVDLQCEINVPCCCSHRGQAVGMRPFLPAPMDIQAWCMCFRQGGEEQEAMENECKLCSLFRRTASVKRCIPPIRALWTFPLPPPIYTSGFLSTKPSLHALQHPGSGKRDHHLLPHASLSQDPAALPAQGCTLSVANH